MRRLGQRRIREKASPNSASLNTLTSVSLNSAVAWVRAIDGLRRALAGVGGVAALVTLSRIRRRVARQSTGNLISRYVPRRRRRTAMPPRASRRMADASIPPRDSTGAGAFGFGEQTPAWPGLSHDCPGGQKGSAQQVSSTQFPDMQSVGCSQAPPFGMPVPVGVTVGVSVAVPVDVPVAVTVAVWVTVPVDVAVAVAVAVRVDVRVDVAVEVLVDVPVAVAVRLDVPVDVAVEVLVDVPVAVAVDVAVAVLVAVPVPVAVGVSVGVEDGVPLGVSVGVAVGVGEGAQEPSQNPDPMAAWAQTSLGNMVETQKAPSAWPPEQSVAASQQARIVPPKPSQIISQNPQVIPNCPHESWNVVTPSHTQQIPWATGTNANSVSATTAAM